MNTRSEIITVNEVNCRMKLGYIATWTLMFRNIWNARFLIQQLFIRDFLAAYKKSFLGIAWILLGPIAGVVSWVFLQKTGMLNPGELDVPYPAYVLIGTACWSFFNGVFTAATKTLSSGKALVMQVNYPHESLLIKEVAQFSANFVLKFSFIILALMFFGVFPKWQIIFFPLVCLPSILIASGFGLVVSMLAVITIDVKKFSNMAFKLLLWTVPVVYGASPTNEYIRLMIKYNPLTYLVCSMRDIVLYGRIYGGMEFYLVSLFSVFIFLAAWRFFFVNEMRLVERMI